jgi:hypothetical protein
VIQVSLRTVLGWDILDPPTTSDHNGIVKAYVPLIAHRAEDPTDRTCVNGPIASPMSTFLVITIFASRPTGPCLADTGRCIEFDKAAQCPLEGRTRDCHRSVTVAKERFDQWAVVLKA